MEASGAQYQFGSVSNVNVEAIGVPGQRTFRLTLASGAAAAILWLEKEQLYQLATYIREVVASLPSDAESQASEAPEPEWSGEIINLDFKVGKLALGHDKSTNCFLLITHEIEEGEGDTATLSFWLTRNQGEGLAEEALKVCAAGRPRCYLCGSPINPDEHMCPRSNGHATLQD